MTFCGTTHVAVLLENTNRAQPMYLRVAAFLLLLGLVLLGWGLGAAGVLAILAGFGVVCVGAVWQLWRVFFGGCRPPPGRERAGRRPAARRPRPAARRG